MKFTPLKLKGAYLIEMEHKKDERGYFARTFCFNEFEKEGLVTQYVQMSTSFNHNKDQIRGMHYQADPYAETKIVRCTRGSILDVIIDIRPDSDTYNEHYGVKLSADNGKILYIPKGFAHGYKVLEDNSEVFYMMDSFFNSNSAREIPWNNDFTSSSI